MLRAIVLSIALLIGIGTLIPLATEYAEAGSKKPRKHKKKGAKKYSKRWWRAYNKRKQIKRAKLRRAKKARAARLKKAKIKRARTARLKRAKVQKRRTTASKKNRVKRGVSSSASRKKSAAAPKPERIVKSNNSVEVGMTQQAPPVVPAAPPKIVKSPGSVEVGMTAPAPQKTSAPAMISSVNTAPQNWNSSSVQGNLQFSVTDTSGSMIGAASISVVGPAVEEPTYSSRVQTVGGVNTNALRRTVIDQMIRENGWVVNDFQKDVGGKKVYVVVAQAPGKNNQVENLTYYFTEVEGKIYSVATKAPEYNLERIEEESEKVLNSLQRRNAPTQLAVNRTVSNLVANEE